MTRTLLLALMLSVPLAARAAEPRGEYTFFKAIWKSCTDGDTCRFDLPDRHPVFGKVVFSDRAVRLMGVDTPELHSFKCEEERVGAEAAKARTIALIQGAAEVRVVVPLSKRELYGRILARVLVDGRDVAEILIAEKLGRPYLGKDKRQGWCG